MNLQFSLQKKVSDIVHQVSENGHFFKKTKLHQKIQIQRSCQYFFNEGG